LFVADAVALSVTSEIGPLMTAILVAARSGSAMTARLGTMVVNEEVDALQQMGIGKTEYLVLPNILGLAISLPLLSVVFAAVALAGGALFMALMTGIDPGIYAEQTRQALQVGDLLLALLKCTLFGILIGTVASTLGLGVSNGSIGVGRATTQTVVVSIFLVILVVALFVALQRAVLA
jgi:phospholipid/cholesterol/gamma-HCH transport system permease protein